MTRSGVMALGLAVLLAVLDLGACMKCYQCNSQNDVNCADPFKGSTSMIVECGSPQSENYNRQYLSGILNGNTLGQVNVQGAAKYCHKLITYSSATNSRTIVRACLDSNPLQLNQTCHMIDTAQNSMTSVAKVVHCSVCDKENCNGVGAVSASIPLATITVLISYLVYKQ